MGRAGVKKKEEERRKLIRMIIVAHTQLAKVYQR